MATVTAGYTWTSGETVTPAKLNSAAAPTVVVADGEVTAAKLASNAVETAKILDANVTAAKLASNAVETAKIADDAVTTAKIADANVTTAKIADGAITPAKLNGAQTGSAPVYGVRAWAKFAGQSSNGACVVNASGNVTSVTRISSGIYEVVMATALPDANYAVLCTSEAYSNRIESFTETTTTFRLEFRDSAAALTNPTEASFMVIR